LRIVLDTNVLVSALLNPRGNPARILRLVLQGDLTVVINEAILAEYRDVLERPRFELDQDAVQTILDTIRSKGLDTPALAESLSLPDRGDEPFLEAALAAHADALATGNRKHFPTEACKGQRVLNPSEFLRLLP